MKKIIFLPVLMCFLSSQTVDTVEYELVPNWSMNLYAGYPIIGGATFKSYDDINPVFGLSIGSPY